jgi:[ribosomal protein S5]-alanine N-acetyltransferase
MEILVELLAELLFELIAQIAIEFGWSSIAHAFHGRRKANPVLAAVGILMGSSTSTRFVRGSFRSGYLGYYAFRPHAGRGYMDEGLRLVLRRAFGALRLHRVEANIQPDNARSIALVRRLGFRREGLSPRYLKVAGRRRDHERWALLAEEWTR